MNTIISLKLKLVTGVVLMAFALLGQDGVVRLQPTAYGNTEGFTQNLPLSQER